MELQNPCRRRLLAGLLAVLFGWLLPRKAPATPLQPSAAADTGYTREVRALSSYSMTDCNQQGEVIERVGPIYREAINTYVYDSRHRLISITQSYGPCTRSN